MDDLSQTLVGTPSYPQGGVGIEGAQAAFRLGSLMDRTARGTDHVAREAPSVARAIAARAVVLAPDGSSRELAERERTLLEALIPADPLDGYDLQASYGAFLLARVAIGLARPVPAALLETPLDREGLLRELRDGGVEAAVAAFVVGDFRGNEPPQSEPLAAAELASLAEGAATGVERERWLARAAWSPRCCSRLAATAALLADVRRTLPLLPSPGAELGAAFVTAATALIGGRPVRALELLGARPDSRMERALAELAETWAALARGEVPRLEEEPELVLPSTAEPRGRTIRGPGLPPPLPPGDDDDVLEVVEERLAAVPLASGIAGQAGSVTGQLPRLPLFGGVDGSFDDAFLADWRRARQARGAQAARAGRWLGLRLTPLPPSVPATAVPPDPQSLALLVERAGLAANDDSRAADTTRIAIGTLLPARFSASVMASPEPIAQAVRVALRAVIVALRGRPPSEDAIELGGDLGWVLARARCLVLGASGDHDAAMSLIARIPGASPEARWVESQRLRFGGRKAPRLELQELALLAVPLVEDLTLAYLGTLSGAIG